MILLQKINKKMIMIHNMIIYKYKNKIKYKLYQRLNYNKKYKN